MIISRLDLTKYPKPPLPVASLPMPNELQCQHTSLSSATDLLKLKPHETHRDPLDHHHQPYGQADQTLPKNHQHHLLLEKCYVAVMSLTSADKKWLIALNPLFDHWIINPPHKNTGDGRTKLTSSANCLHEATAKT